MGRPNIVYILSDQHGYRFNGFAGHPVVRTPNLDRIAREGGVFHDNYCAHPSCGPSRASLMTGMYSCDVNSFCNSTVWDGSHPTWVSRLAEAGYQCTGLGKMDLNLDHPIGFQADHTRSNHCRNPDITSLFRAPGIYRYNERPFIDGDSCDQPKESDKTKFGLEFLKERQRDGESSPWLLYLGYHQPHPAFVALREYYDAYLSEGVDMPEVDAEELENLHLVYQNARHFKRMATPIPDDRIRRARAAYYGMITELDAEVGRIYDALKASGQLENTLFIYTSDHGESLGEHGLWLKSNLFDEAARVPMIVAGAGLPGGREIHDPVGHVDLAATLLELAGVEVPDSFRGRSLLGLMKEDPDALAPDAAYCECHSEGNCTGSFMIRKGDWKYIHFTFYDQGLLFNVRKDPREKQNRFGDPEVAGVQADLLAELQNRVDPEEVTLRAFETQNRILQGLIRDCDENELFERFRRRIGDGQARTLAARIKRTTSLW